MERKSLMIFSDATAKLPALTESRQATQSPDSILSRKIWLPKVFYDALPCFYIAAGLAALFATLYISDWFWVLPHSLLFTAACLHMGAFILKRRDRG